MGGKWGRSVEEKILDYTIVVGECWLWQRALNHAGYGVVGIGGKRARLAHRAAYEIYVGPIPEGKELDHTCPNRSCVYYGHLEAVTHLENVRRGNGAVDTHIRFQARTHCINGHELDEDNTYSYINHNGYEVRECRTCKYANRKRSWEKIHGGGTA